VAATKRVYEDVRVSEPSVKLEGFNSLEMTYLDRQFQKWGRGILTTARELEGSHAMFVVASRKPGADVNSLRQLRLPSGKSGAWKSPEEYDREEQEQIRSAETRYECERVLDELRQSNSRSPRMSSSRTSALTSIR